MNPSVDDIETGNEEVKALYNKLTAEEGQVDRELRTLLSRQCHLDAKVRGIVKVLPNLEIIHSDAKQLAEMLNFTSTLAENVSSKVRKLDTARSRVSECQQRVHDLLDLQLCSDGVQTSLHLEDYEKAAGHIHRYLSMDQRMLEKTADDVNQDCTTVNKSISLLQEAAEKMKGIISAKFNEAVKKDDTASVERFFKLFPLLNMHDFGLQQFSCFLCTKIDAVSKKNLKSALGTSSSDKRAGVIYADALTLLFEEVARTVEVHQPLVETFYGPGRLIKLISSLQVECDKQSKLILNELWKQRQLEKLSSMLKDRARSNIPQQQKIDPKDIDQLLLEITVMHSRYNLYLRFLRRKVSGDLEVALIDENKKTSGLEELEKRIKDSELCCQMQMLLGHYLLLEHFYMEESVKKAIAMDVVETNSNISSMIDDVFFIVKKCIRRASGTGNIDGVCAVINNACTVLETEMCSTLLHTMRQGFPSGYLDLTQAYNVMIQGRLQPSDTEQAKTTFIAHLNNTEVGNEYVGTLCSGLVSEVVCSTETESRKLESCLGGLSSVSAAMGAAQELGLQQLRSTAIKPRIAPWLESFLAISHNLSEDEFSSYEANEPFIRSLIGHLENLLSEFRTTLMPTNYDNLVGIVATEVNLQMEKVIMKTEFNRLGGLALDKEVRLLVSYLSNATSWSVRDKFARLTQIATILNLDKVSDISDYWGVSTVPWRLSPVDIKKVMKLRVDFRSEDIARLKL